MGRKKKEKVCRRVQVRLSESEAEIFDSYNSDQISSVLGIALKSISPESKLGEVITSVLRPREPITETIARISWRDSYVRVFFPEKLEVFRQAVKNQCGYVWDSGMWSRKATEKTASDRMAEVAFRLLDAGFIVQVEYSEVAKKIAAGSFVAEALHLVKVVGSGVYKEWFTFSFPRGEEWYDEIMSLTAARYDSGMIVVPPEHYAELEDFAEQNEFKFSESAFKNIQKWKQIRDVQQLIDIKSVQSGKKKKKTLPINQQDVPESLIDD